MLGATEIIVGLGNGFKSRGAIDTRRAPERRGFPRSLLKNPKVQSAGL